VLIVALAGCNKSDSDPATTQSGETAGRGASGGLVDACAVVTAGDAAALLGVEPIDNVDFPFRIRQNRQGAPDVDQPDLLGECLWLWEVPPGETFELAQVQFYVWDGETFYSDPPVNEGEYGSIDVGDRGVIVTVPPENDGDAYLVSFVVGGKTVWLDAAIWRNPGGRADLIELARSVASELG